VHDVMLAASCRQSGHTLVTANQRDFELIRKVERFEFVPPFPD
jgi:predicted nucleic acid-binding protein